MRCWHPARSPISCRGFAIFRVPRPAYTATAVPLIITWTFLLGSTANVSSCFPTFPTVSFPAGSTSTSPGGAHLLDNLADVLVVAPSARFVSRLPDGKITDRKDFYRFAGDDQARFACWQQVADAGKILADDFIDAVESGNIRNRVQPLPDTA